MKNIALLFPGQGSQYVGMGKELSGQFKAAAEVFEEANDSVGFDLRKMCFEGSMEELTKTENTQPAILTASVAAFRVYMEEIGVSPLYTAGHSLGEFSALCCAGVLSFSDAARLVRKRGLFMQSAVPLGVGSMAAVSGVSRQAIEDECKKISSEEKIVVVSNYNSPDQIVISGHADAVQAASEDLKSMGARVIPLKVSAPFHSPLMQPAADKLKEELERYSYGSFKWPVISNVTAAPYESEEKIIEYLSMQIVKPVKWQPSMEYLKEKGIELVVEVGPQTVLRNLMKKNVPGIKAISYESEQDRKTVKANILQVEGYGEGPKRGADIITKCIAIAVCTKNSNWNNDEYTKGVIEPYRKVQAMKEEIEKEGRQPSVDEVKEAVKMLISVFTTKKTSVEEQIERFKQVFPDKEELKDFEDLKIPG